LKIALKIAESNEVNWKTYITEQKALVEELEAQFKVRQEEMAIQA
jgi:hypothetical protein